MRDKDKRDNPPPIFHLIEADAKPPSFRNVGLVIVGALIITAALMFDPKPVVVDIRRNYPEPRTIQELRTANHLEALGQCELPRVSTAASWRVLPGPDSAFTVTLPVPWYRSSLDTSTADLHDATATFRDRADNHIEVRRRPYGRSSGSYIANPDGTRMRPEKQCEVSSKTAGTIWTFHSLLSSDHTVRYIGLADAVTTSGKRYQIDLGSWTRARRDTLAALLAAEVLRQ
ncbi:MAG TPA: hypothetical protein VD758_03280 [Gemmatimonadaceae bacterium]|nr:hypothetical protein [Gemmatimonadaceae bacterium]